MDSSSHRERSKSRRRAAIELAGLRLFAENGYAATTITEIAAAADVAPRTVSIYFPTKLDIALSYSNAFAARLADAFDDGTSRLPLIEILDQWLTAERQEDDLERRRLVAAAHRTNPSLPTIGPEVLSRVLTAARKAIAVDLGHEADDFATQLAVSSLISVLSAIAAANPDEQDFAEMQTEALVFLSAGLDTLRTTVRNAS